jgi:hypothetical protein
MGSKKYREIEPVTPQPGCICCDPARQHPPESSARQPPHVAVGNGPFIRNFRSFPKKRVVTFGKTTIIA